MRIPARRPGRARDGVTRMMGSMAGCTPTSHQATERIRSNEREASGESVCASECVRACACVYLPAGRPACPSASLSVCPSVRVSVYGSVSVSACAPVPSVSVRVMSIRPSVSVYYVCPSLCPSVRAPVCLCVRIGVCARGWLFAQVRACASACVRACACVPRARVCVGLARHSSVLPSSALGSPLPHLHRI